MENKIGDRVFELPDSCPIDAPKKQRLMRHLRDHGPESLLTSAMLAPFAQCILNEILDSLPKPTDGVEEPVIRESEAKSEGSQWLKPDNQMANSPA